MGEGGGGGERRGGGLRAVVRSGEGGRGRWRGGGSESLMMKVDKVKVGHGVQLSVEVRKEVMVRDPCNLYTKEPFPQSHAGEEYMVSSCRSLTLPQESI